MDSVVQVCVVRFTVIIASLGRPAQKGQQKYCKESLGDKEAAQDVPDILSPIVCTPPQVVILDNNAVLGIKKSISHKIIKSTSKQGEFLTG